MKKNLALVIVLVVVALPLTIFLSQKSQDTRSKAAGTSVLDVSVGQSIQSAIDSAKPGDTINVAAGTYNETLNVSNSGSAENYITIQSTGGQVITNGPMKISGKYVKLIGFTSKGSGDYGAQMNGADNTILQKFEIDGSQDGGLIISGSSNFVIDSCNIHGTNAKGTSAQGEALSITGGSTNFEVKNCQVHDNGEEGIDVKYNGPNDINGIVHDNQTFGNRGPNIYVDGSSGVKIYNNTSYGTTNDSKSGIMVAAETAYDGPENPKHASNIDIFNNVIYGNAGGGMTYWVESGGTLSDIRFYNNTIDQSKSISVLATPGGTNPVFNNIYTGSADTAGLQMSNNLTSNPGFAGSGDYHLTAGSAAIDKGTAAGAPAFDHDNKTRPAGAGIDIGAYEYGATGGGGGTVTPPEPTGVTPTLYCLSGAPCTPTDTPDPSGNPSTNPSQTPGGGGGGGGGGGTTPSNFPSPSTDPCAVSNSDSDSVSTLTNKHHRKHRGGGGGFIQQFIQFLLQLLEQLFQKFGIQFPGFPGNPGGGGGGTPCPSPTQSTPSTAPSESVQTSPSPTISAALSPTTNASQSAPAGNTKSVEITFYGAYDNDPKGSTAISNPVIHQKAGGTGTYADPLTFASPDGAGAYKIGQIIYVPSVQKYFVREDTCAVSWTAPNGCGAVSHVDLYMGNPSDSQTVVQCENALTPSGNGTIILDPPSNLTVDPTPLWNQSTGKCMTLH